MTTIATFAQRPIEAQIANGAVSQDSVCTTQEDETEVFAAVLKEKALPQVPLVLVTTTEATDGNVDHASQSLAIGGHKLPSELRDGFKAINKSSCIIAPFAGIKNLSFISEAEKDRLLLAGTRDIQKRYGKRALLIRFSRAAFNAEKNLALLHVSVGTDQNTTGGILYLLERKDGVWLITTKVETTILSKPARP